MKYLRSSHNKQLEGCIDTATDVTFGKANLQKFDQPPLLFLKQGKKMLLFPCYPEGKKKV